MTTTPATPPIRRRRPLLLKIAILVVVLLVAWLYASPYWVLRQLEQAVDLRDAQAISSHVDFPALRDSLKLQLTGELTHALGGAQQNNPLAVLGAMVGSAVIGPLVETYASPSGVAAILNGMPPVLLPGSGAQQPPALEEGSNADGSAAGGNNVGAAADAGAAGPADGASSPRVQAHAGYRGLNQFVVTYTRAGGGSSYSAVFERRGLFDWKLVALDLAN